jgi:Pecanex protein (C-terminus)
MSSTYSHNIEVKTAFAAPSDESPRPRPRPGPRPGPGQGASGSSTSQGDNPGAPLVNDDKAVFVWARWLQTLLGGIHISWDDDTIMPLSVRLIEILSFLMLPSIGAIFSYLQYDDPSSSESTSRLFIFGISAGIIIIRHIISIVAYHARRSAVLPFDDPDDIGIGGAGGGAFENGVCSSITWSALFGKPNWWLYWPGSVVMGSVAVVACTILLDVHEIGESFGVSGTSRLIVLIAGWLVAACALFPIINFRATEMATFRVVLSQECMSMSRPVHIVGLGVLLEYVLSSQTGTGSTILRSIFFALPFMWSTGMLGQTDSILAWAFERFQVDIAGSSPSMNIARSIIDMIASAIAIIGTGAVLKYVSPTLGTTLAFAFAILLGTGEFQSILENIWYGRQLDAHGRRSVTVAIVVAVLIGLTGAVLHVLELKDIGSTELESIQTDDTMLIAAASLLSCLWICNEISRRTSLSASKCTPVMMNITSLIAVAAWLVLGNHMISDSVGAASIGWSFIHAAVSLKGFRLLLQESYAHRAVISLAITIWLNYAAVFPASLFDTDRIAPQFFLVTILTMDRATHAWHLAHYTVSHVLSCFALSKNNLRHSVVFGVLSVLLAPFHIVMWAWAVCLRVPLVPLFGSPIIIASFPRPQRLWKHLSASRDTDAAQSSGNHIELIDAEHADVAHLTPNNHDQTAAGGATSMESEFYDRIANAVCDSIGKNMNGDASVLLSGLRTGHMLLFRVDSLVLIARVLEHSRCGLLIQLTGLERQQQTSCHAVEAGVIDRVFGIDDQSEHDDTDENDEKHAHVLDSTHPRCSIESAMRMFDPLMTIRVPVFGETTTSMVGIIDSVDNLKFVSQMFMRIMQVLAYQNNDIDWEHITSRMKHVPEYELDKARPKYCTQLEQHLDEVKLDTDAAIEVEPLRDQRRQCVVTAYVIVELAATMGGTTNITPDLGPEHVAKVFSGQVPTSLHSRKLEETTEFQTLVLQSYRMAVKLLYDAVALSEVGDFLAQTPEAFELLKQRIAEYQDNWIIAPFSKAASIRQHGEQERRIFSVVFNSKKRICETHMLEMQKETVFVGSLNAACVESIWASLAMELLYFTNDDDERYSIQSHPWHLRNLCVQAAEAPLGYSVFNSIRRVHL